MIVSSNWQFKGERGWWYEEVVRGLLFARTKAAVSHGPNPLFSSTSKIAPKLDYSIIIYSKAVLLMQYDISDA